MKSTVKFISLIILGLIVIIILWFLWASSPNYSESDYSKLIINNHANKNNKDSIYSIVTYNIGYLSGMTNNKAMAKPKDLFDNNLEKVKKEIEKLNVDFIAFQEIDYASARSYNVNQQNEFAQLGYNYLAQAINWDETYVPYPYWPPSLHFGKILSGQSILSKYPLKNHQRIILERVKANPFYRDALYLERLAQMVTSRIHNKDIVIINVHLEAFDKPTRVKQMDFVINLFNEQRKLHPTILLGDFNSDQNYKDPVIKKMFGLLNVGNAAFLNENPASTYSSIDPFKRVDYIFYSSNSIEYIGGSVLTQFGQASDHLPVEMKFKLK